VTVRSCFCGIDVGTQGVRVAIVDHDGTSLGAGSRPLPDGRREAGEHEQRGEEWWDALVGAVRDAMGSAVEDLEVVAVALDATSGTVLLEGADGAARGPALMYDDGRALDQAIRVERTGRALWSELGYRMQPTWALPKVLWLLENAAPSIGDRVVHQSDHLVRRLTGTQVATDTSHALKTGADLRTATWPSAVLDELGVPLDRLPDLVLPGTVVGTINDEAARLTGLVAGTPVRAGMTDGCASQIAAGALRAGSWSSALGTTLVIKGSTPEPVQDPHGAVYSHRHPDGGWLPGGASSSGAGALRDALPADSDFDILTAGARGRGVVLGATYPLVGEGERFPFVAPEARGFMSPHATDDVARFAALCQGVAFVERLAYDVLGVLGADVSGPISLTGGAARNPWWNQLRTDVLGRPTTRPDAADAATGMAIMAASEPGELTPTAERMVRITERRQPDPARRGELDGGYVALVEALADRGWLDAELARSAVERTGMSS
jgi:sugar (pentulose or hexulose) kinase